VSDIWIAGINTGHNSSTCLLKNGEIIFLLEEERLSRKKYDEMPFLGIQKIKEFTNKLDYFAVPYEHQGVIDVNPFIAFARKLGLIENNKQIINYDSNVLHHTYHAAGAFYNSGFDEAVVVIMDGSGSLITSSENSYGGEIQSIYKISGIDNIELLFKVCSNPDNHKTSYANDGVLKFVSHPGIGMLYNSLAQSLGHSVLECGKAMGLSSYGKEDLSIPPIYVDIDGEEIPNRNLFVPYQEERGFWCAPFLLNKAKYNDANLCWAIQRATEKKATEFILQAIQISGCKNVVVSGGFGLNCVANYEYLKHLPAGAKLFVDPPAYDGGLSVGAAQLAHAKITGKKSAAQKNYYLGPIPSYAGLDKLPESFNTKHVTYSDVVDLLLDGNIVAMYQGRSEAGPRALGNRSILFDPRVKDGKDIVNGVKHREWYRPFAGTIMKEFVHDYFDMRGIDESPFMMYAVNVLEDKKQIIPSITHVDGTCRIQTVTTEQNAHYYNLISEFNSRTGVPILFNTSFNLGGDPMVETIEDAINTLQKSDLKYLYLPEKDLLITKQPK
jgi:carbamoyltransferase